MLVSSFLARRDDRSAQLIADIADAYAIPEKCFGFYVWTFHDGSSLVMTGRETLDSKFQYSFAMAFDSDGVEIHSVDLNEEVANKPALSAEDAAKEYRFGKAMKNGVVRWIIA